MGTTGSFLRSQDEDDIGNERGSRGVIKRIPIEVKPRGKLGLRSVNSIGNKKNKVGGSLRSALSIDLDPEVEKIRRDFEMYRLNKENEMASLKKKEERLETENRRLRGELQALQKTCRRYREEREAALEAEHQALVRAAAFESDRDKIQRQFKIFRETKENETQTLLRARRELENKLAKLSHSALEDMDSASRAGMEMLGAGNPGDWWTALESEPSLGSTSQLHITGLKGPEFALSAMEMDGPFTNVNKEDWTVAAASLQHIIPSIPETMATNCLSIYIVAPFDVHTEVKILLNEYEHQLDQLCHWEGRFLTIIHMTHDGHDNNSDLWHACHLEARRKRIDQATVFVSFLGEHLDKFTEVEIMLGHLENPGMKPAVFAFKEKEKHTRSKRKASDMDDLKRRITENGSCKILDGYSTAQQAAQFVYTQVDKILRAELGIDGKREKDLAESLLAQEGPEMLCGGCLWDPKQDYEQLQALSLVSKSTCELAFEQYYERLFAHVASPGPLPPLLVTGSHGSGRSLLLAKWMELQQQRSSSGLVLYHLVGSHTSCSADPILMIRRLTGQLMQHVTSPPALTCDPVRLVEEFPRWLEKVSTKLPAGIVLLIDSIDRFQNIETLMKWLMDPLPVDLRVVLSLHEDHCPQSWKAWPRLHIRELSNKNVRELLRAELASHGRTISGDQERAILNHCNTPQTCVPLYMILLAGELARTSEEWLDKRLMDMLEARDTVELYKTLLEYSRNEHEDPSTRGLIKKVVELIYASRNGLTETELFAIVPELSWTFWAPVYETLNERHIITRHCGILTFIQEQARMAVGEVYFSDDETWLKTVRTVLRDYYAQFQCNIVKKNPSSARPHEVTSRCSDELPWLNHMLDDKESLRKCLSNLCIFVKLYGRGGCGELMTSWQYAGVDKSSVAKTYMDALRYMESMVGQCDGLVTLPRIADVYEALGRFFRDINLLTEALTPLQRALEIREMALDPDHPAVAQTLHQVAGLHAQQGKFSTAEALYKQALDIYEGAFGREHFLIAKELDALAVLYQKQGKHEHAEPLHKRALSIRRKCGAPRISSAPVRSIDPLKRRVLQLEELAMGPDSADLARTLNELGVLYYLQNNIHTAETFFKRALEMREGVLEENHPLIAQSLNNLAALYNDRKQYEQAEPLYQKALQIRLKHYGPEHQAVASIINQLAMLYKKMGKLCQAEPLYRQSVEIREKSFGDHHPAVATALVNLAVLHSQQGHHSEAEPLYNKALRIYEESLGPSHPRVAETLKNLALLKYEQGEFETAAKLYKRAMDIKENDPTYAAKAAASRCSSSAGTLPRK